MGNEYNNPPIYHLDANCVNSRQRLADVNRLEQWERDGVIRLMYSRVAHGEAEDGYDIRRWSKVNAYFWEAPVDNLDDENNRIKEIENVVFLGGAKNTSEVNDVKILYTAWKAGATLITRDGESKMHRRILSSKQKLLEIGIRVVSTRDAVLEIENYLQSIEANPFGSARAFQ